MKETSINRTHLLIKSFFRLVTGLPIMYLLLAVAAGTPFYWQAWLYMAVLFIPMGIALIYFMIKDPELLERRLHAHEKEKDQRRLILISIPYFFLIYIIPGLDIRFGWSNLPNWLPIAGSLVVFLGYLFFFVVLHQNSFAARTIQVESEQTVIDTGLYSHVRHPMYTAIILMYCMTPIALGSAWAVLISIWIIPMMLFRIRGEETVLKEKLEGYRDYCEHVRYRLIPGIW